MGFVRKILLPTVGTALLGAGTPARAEPAEPLIVTRLADPDPNYVPPPEAKHGRRHAVAGEADASVDAVMAFGQALGQAMQAQQQLIEQQCKASEAANEDDSQRMAWEAACKYTRK